MGRLKHQLILFFFFTLYIITRLIGISDLEFTFWQSIWVFAVKNSLLVFAFIFLTYAILDSIRRRSRTGPQIISGKNLKKIFYPALLFSWLAVVTHTFFEILKILLPFNLLPLYQFADFMDETIAHIFMYLPFICLIFIITILEIERPSSSRLRPKESILLAFLSSLAGILWGLNLTEGRLSLVTSLPAMIIYLILVSHLFIKYRLKFNSRPWGLFGFIASFTASLSFIIWTLINHSAEFFTSLK